MDPTASGGGSERLADIVNLTDEDVETTALYASSRTTTSISGNWQSSTKRDGVVHGRESATDAAFVPPA
jgi:hypothetical protein